MTAFADRIRALPERYGRRTLIVLAAIAVLGLGLRAYAVVDPVADPADDSHAYYALSKALYEEGSFGGKEFHDSSDWSPGAPLLYAAAFYATGGAREGTARIVEALLGLGAILVVFLLGERLGGRRAGLLAAFAVAVYPPFIHSTGELMSEPPAILTLPAAVLAFLWAAERDGSRAWLVPGPAVRADGDVPARVPPGRARPSSSSRRSGSGRPRLAPGTRRARRSWPRPCWRRSSPGRSATSTCSAAWCRSRPAAARRSTSAPTCPPTANTSGSRRSSTNATTDRSLPPDSQALNEVNPTPLFNRVAKRYPGLPRDSALGKIGKQHFSKYFGEDPGAYLAMTARKVGRMWSSGVGAAMSSGLGRAVQILLVAPRARGARAARPARRAGGIWSRWRRRSPSSPRSARSPSPPRAATRC